MWRGLRHSAENPSRARTFPRERKDLNQLSPISPKVVSLTPAQGS